jgi:hypothetical protein
MLFYVCMHVCMAYREDLSSGVGILTVLAVLGMVDLCSYACA